MPAHSVCQIQAAVRIETGDKMQRSNNHFARQQVCWKHPPPQSVQLAQLMALALKREYELLVPFLPFVSFAPKYVIQSE